MSRVLRGAWSRRGALTTLVLMTVGRRGRRGDGAAVRRGRGHVSPWLAAPLLLLGAVAVPSIGAELAVARREEIGLARLRGIHGLRLWRFLLLEPLLAIVLGHLRRPRRSARPAPCSPRGRGSTRPPPPLGRPRPAGRRRHRGRRPGDRRRCRPPPPCASRSPSRSPTRTPPAPGDDAGDLPERAGLRRRRRRGLPQPRRPTVSPTSSCSSVRRSSASRWARSRSG